jgi:hypothetical protein
MTIGGSIALIVLGAILAFAVEFNLAGLNINVIGFILMLGGLVGLLFGLFYAERGGYSRRTVRTEAAPVAERRVVERPVAERRVVEDRVVEDREVY